MKALRLQSSWKETKEKLKEVNSDLAEEDLQYDADHPELLLNRLAAKMNRDVQQVKEWVESVSANRSKAS